MTAEALRDAHGAKGANDDQRSLVPLKGRVSRMMRYWRWPAIAALGGFCLVSVGGAAEEGGVVAKGVSAGASQDAEFFEKEIRPIFADHCTKCHGDGKK